MDITEIRWENVDWIHLAQESYLLQALVNTAINVRVSLKARNFLTR
jgi:hypothetical protein